jgi:hypothetical protein
MIGDKRIMDSRDRFETKGVNFEGYEPEVLVREYPARMPKGRSSSMMNNLTREAPSRFSDKTSFAGPNWSGNIMWTFAFGEKEIGDMGRSVFSCGRQAWHLLNQMNDLCKTRHQTRLKSSMLLMLLASELHAIAIESLESRFALELRVIRGADGMLDLELMDNGMWRKPSLRVSTKSQQGAIRLEMGD